MGRGSRTNDSGASRRAESAAVLYGSIPGSRSTSSTPLQVVLGEGRHVDLDLLASQRDFLEEIGNVPEAVLGPLLAGVDHQLGRERKDDYEVALDISEVREAREILEAGQLNRDPRDPSFDLCEGILNICDYWLDLAEGHQTYP